MKIYRRNKYTLYLVRDGKAEKIDTYNSKLEAALVQSFFLKDEPNDEA